jgi:hypothetical protein
MQQRIMANIRAAARHSVQQIRKEINGDFADTPSPDNPFGLTRRGEQKRRFERIDSLDDAFVFSDNIRVAKIDEAAVIIDMTLLKKMYGEFVFQQMALPNDIFITQRAMNYRSDKGSQSSIFSNAISSMLTDPMHQRARQDQRLYVEMFANVATAPFDKYHMDKIIDMVEQKDKAMDQLMKQVTRSSQFVFHLFYFLHRSMRSLSGTSRAISTGTTSTRRPRRLS